MEGRLTLTAAGRRLREAIRTRWQDFQQRQVAGIPEQDLRATSRTLSKLIAQNQTAS
jgi:DNA-binding MarR family transcriptional regulator